MALANLEGGSVFEVYGEQIQETQETERPAWVGTMEYGIWELKRSCRATDECSAVFDMNRFIF